MGERRGGAGGAPATTDGGTPDLSIPEGSISHVADALPIQAQNSRPRNPRMQKKAEVVARQLIDRIVTDGVGDGDRLDHEAQLVDQMAVSRATLREAFRLLEVAGILQLRPGRDGGAIVREPTGEDFARMATLFFQVTRCTYRDLLRTCIAIEPAIYAQAATAADDEARRRIAQLWDDGGQPASDATQLYRLTHMTMIVAEASGNPIMVFLISTLTEVFGRHMDRFLVGVPQRREGAWVARQVAEAVVAGDGERAARLLKANLEGWMAIAEHDYPQILDALVSWDS